MCKVVIKINYLGVRAGYPLYLFYKKIEKDAALIPNAIQNVIKTPILISMNMFRYLHFFLGFYS